MKTQKRQHHKKVTQDTFITSLSYILWTEGIIKRQRKEQRTKTIVGIATAGYHAKSKYGPTIQKLRKDDIFEKLFVLKHKSVHSEKSNVWECSQYLMTLAEKALDRVEYNHKHNDDNEYLWLSKDQLREIKKADPRSYMEMLSAIVQRDDNDYKVLNNIKTPGYRQYSIFARMKSEARKMTSYNIEYDLNATIQVVLRKYGQGDSPVIDNYVESKSDIREYLAHKYNTSLKEIKTLITSLTFGSGMPEAYRNDVWLTAFAKEVKSLKKGLYNTAKKINDPDFITYMEDKVKNRKTSKNGRKKDKNGMVLFCLMEWEENKWKEALKKEIHVVGIDVHDAVYYPDYAAKYIKNKDSIIKKITKDHGFD